jgi:hypothetical protein
MTAVSGLLRIGEATPTMRSIGARQRGSNFFYYAILFGTIAAGGFCGNLFARYVGYFDTEPATLIGVGVGTTAYMFIARPLTTARFRSRMVQKGHPPLLQIEVEITPDTLLYRVGDIRHAAPWSAVSELFESRGYWIFLVQSSPFFAPKRFFEGPAAEKAFLRAALERMSEDARGRSEDAVAFAKAS